MLKYDKIGYDVIFNYWGEWGPEDMKLDKRGRERFRIRIEG